MSCCKYRQPSPLNSASNQRRSGQWAASACHHNVASIRLSARLWLIPPNIHRRSSFHSRPSALDARSNGRCRSPIAALRFRLPPYDPISLADCPRQAEAVRRPVPFGITIPSTIPCARQPPLPPTRPSSSSLIASCSDPLTTSHRPTALRHRETTSRSLLPATNNPSKPPPTHASANCPIVASSTRPADADHGDPSATTARTVALRASADLTGSDREGISDDIIEKTRWSHVDRT